MRGAGTNGPASTAPDIRFATNGDTDAHPLTGTTRVMPAGV
jgi:hypothetical protein